MHYMYKYNSKVIMLWFILTVLGWHLIIFFWEFQQVSPIWNRKSLSSNKSLKQCYNFWLFNNYFDKQLLYEGWTGDIYLSVSSPNIPGSNPSHSRYPPIWLHAPAPFTPGSRPSYSWAPVLSTRSYIYENYPHLTQYDWK